MEDRTHAALVIGVIALAILGVVYLSITTLPLALFMIYAVVFLIGFAFMHLLSYTIGPSLPSFFSEPLANLIWIVSMVGIRKPVLEQTEGDEYQIRRAEEEYDPPGYWMRWALSPFGITIEKTRKAFEPFVVDEEKQDAMKDLEEDIGRKKASVEHERGDEPGFVDKRDLDADYLINLPHALSIVEGAGGPDIGFEAWNQMMQEEGGDTSGNGPAVMMFGRIFMAFMGIAVGYVMFV